MYTPPLNTQSDRRLQGSNDLRRESDLITSQVVRERVLRDDDLITQVRAAVEASRLYNEAYGGRMSADDYVRITLESLADALAARHRSDSRTPITDN